MENFLSKLESISNDLDKNFSLYALKTKNPKIVATKIPIDPKQLGSFSKECISYLHSKVYHNRDLKCYPYGVPKDHIESLSLGSELIKAKYDELINAISSPETNDVTLDKYNAYAIVYKNNDTKMPTIFINMKKPLKNYGKNSFLACFVDNDYKKIDTSLINLVMHFDCIISPDTCYFITLEVEKLFNLAQHYQKETQKSKEVLREFNVISESDIERIDIFLRKPGKYKCLSQVDKKIINDFSKVDIKKKNMLVKKYRLEFISNSDGTYNIDLSDENKIQDFIYTITNKRGLDFDNHIVETSSPFKRTL